MNDRRGNIGWWDLSTWAAARHGVFDRADARRHSVSGAKIDAARRRGEIEALFLGVYRFVAYPRTFVQQAYAATKYVKGSHISHETAAVLHGFDGFTAEPDPDSTPVHLTVERKAQRSRPGLRVHRWRQLSGQDVTRVQLIPCASIPASLVQLGVDHGLIKVRNATIGALRRGMDPRWLEQTMGRMARPGPTGLSVMRRVLALEELQGRPVESVLEIVTERFSAEAGLPALQRQIAVRTANGLRRIDAGVVEVKLGIEATSFKHHFGFEAGESDTLRNLELGAEGWHLEYLTWWACRQPEVFADLLLRSYFARLELFGQRAA